MKPTDDLIEEHESVKEMLKVMDKVSQKLEIGETVQSRHLESIINFIQVFVDRCHHGKEETLLFPAIVEVGIQKENGLVQELLSEHDTGRRYIKEIIGEFENYQRGQGSAALRIAENTRGYIALLVQHINKEDTVLFPFADKHLSDTKQQYLMKGFEEIEEKVIGAGKHEELHNTLHQLVETYSG